MKNRSFVLLTLAISIMAISWVGCGGGSGDNGDDGGGDGPTPATTVTLSGQVAVSGADADLASPLSKSFSKNARPVFKTIATTGLAGAAVSLVKIKADGSEEDSGITATTDSSGNFTLSDVPKPTAGTGASTDYYYEIRATSGSLEVRAPAAPEADKTINLSPETTIAADMLTAVAQTEAIPLAPAIENERELVATDVNEFSSKSAITTSVSTDSANASQQIIAANALPTNGANSEKMIEAFESESEAAALLHDSSASEASVSSYMQRTVQGSCDFDSNLVLPLAATDAMARAFIAGTTYTPSLVVSAFNNYNLGDPEADAGTAASGFGTLLSALDSDFDAKTEIADADALPLFVKRDLAGSSFAADTALVPDQAIVFLQNLYSNQCQPGTGTDVTGIIADLTGDSVLASPVIADYQIYHDRNSECTDGRFQAEVRVFTPANSGILVSSVSVSGGAFGNVNLTLAAGPRYTYQGTAKCVTFGQDATYTITAQLSNGATLTETVLRNHPNVPEQTTTFSDGTPLARSGEETSPTATVNVRPIFTWTSPAAALANTPNAPSGSAIKYTYEFSHYNKNASPIGPLTGCGQVPTAGELYSRNNFMPSVDCDPVACAAAAGLDASVVACRMYISAYLVDEYDRLLGKSPGNFNYFCVDTNGDGSCG